MDIYLIAFLIIILGLIIGHLINLYIRHLPREKNLSKLQPWLIEVLSISTAALSYYTFESIITAILIFVMSATLIAITFIDLEFKIIPDKINFPGIIIGLILGLISSYCYKLDPPLTQSIYDSLLGLAIGLGIPFIFVYLYFLITKKIGFGMGDIKLLGLFGTWFGWQATLAIFFLSSIFGSIFGIIFMFATKQNRKTEISFGPWLALAAIVYMFRLIELIV
ncbi:MAG: A24 family peptidase [Deltaproteobacteria bacterium]|jgi:leader peptidase (prepilin peptidase)/N-methyltransferase|nr:A24 family peptidase [Deltaproteobacteria bacterium]